MAIRELDYYEQALGELIHICCDADERKSPKWSDSGLLVYRGRKPVDVQLIVANPSHVLPQLVGVRKVEYR